MILSQIINTIFKSKQKLKGKNYKTWNSLCNWLPEYFWWCFLRHHLVKIIIIATINKWYYLHDTDPFKVLGVFASLGNTMYRARADSRLRSMLPGQERVVSKNMLTPNLIASKKEIRSNRDWHSSRDRYLYK